MFCNGFHGGFQRFSWFSCVFQYPDIGDIHKICIRALAIKRQTHAHAVCEHRCHMRSVCTWVLARTCVLECLYVCMCDLKVCVLASACRTLVFAFVLLGYICRPSGLLSQCNTSDRVPVKSKKSPRPFHQGGNAEGVRHESTL